MQRNAQKSLRTAKLLAHAGMEVSVRTTIDALALLLSHQSALILVKMVDQTPKLAPVQLKKLLAPEKLPLGPASSPGMKVWAVEEVPNPSQT